MGPKINLGNPANISKMRQCYFNSISPILNTQCPAKELPPTSAGQEVGKQKLEKCFQKHRRKLLEMAEVLSSIAFMNRMEQE